MDKCNQFLYYALTHPNETSRYHASNIILMTDIDAAYLVLPECLSHIVGYYYFTNRMLDYYKVNPTPKGPTLTECKTLKTIFPSSV